MKFNPFKFILVFAAVLSLTACDWLDTTVADVSSNPTFVSLKFAANDTVPGLSYASFTLEWDETIGDSIIVNLDSLPYQTDISNVIPTFSFYSSAGAYVYLSDSLNIITDTIALTGTDTLNFNKVVKIQNYAADLITDRTYTIKVNVHKVDAELYQWNKVTDHIYTHAGSNQKGFLFNDSIFLYVNSGVNNSLYKSPDGINWGPRNLITSLPISTEVDNILKFNNKLYLASDGTKLLVTSNGVNWSEVNWTNANSLTKDFTFVNLLFPLNNKIWAIAKSNIDQSYRFASSSDGISWTVLAEIPNNFPIGDFSSISFASRSSQPKALIAGGYTASGVLLNNIWSTENGTYWVDFSTENTTLGALSGTTIISYDDKLLLFGGADASGEVVDNPYMQSIDEGLSWSIPDTTYNQLRQMNISTNNDTTYTYYKPRYNQTAIVASDNRIILIGGRDKTTVYSDVWVGKLNRLGFATK